MGHAKLEIQSCNHVQNNLNLLDHLKW